MDMSLLLACLKSEVPFPEMASPCCAWQRSPRGTAPSAPTFVQSTSDTITIAWKHKVMGNVVINGYELQLGSPYLCGWQTVSNRIDAHARRHIDGYQRQGVCFSYSKSIEQWKE